MIIEITAKDGVRQPVCIDETNLPAYKERFPDLKIIRGGVW